MIKQVVSVFLVYCLWCTRTITAAYTTEFFSRLTNTTIKKDTPKFPPRYALVIALAGNKKLTEYFSWSCRTIFDSRDRFDLLVFHENNQLLRNVTCAENVKFYNLGERGLSTEIVKTVMNTDDISSDASQQLAKVVDTILQHIPTYLSEIKPMMGALFARYLTSYSYWSYSDPDIIYGSLSRWIADDDLQQYHYYSLARHWDAGRLYLRSQFTLHRNVPEVNYLWQRLTYFQAQEFASRVGNIVHAIIEAKDDRHREGSQKKPVPPTEAISRKFFHNPEGWYSKLVFEDGPGQVKIIGRVFDDFFREPIVRIKTPLLTTSTASSTTITATSTTTTTLLRCQQAMNVSHCIQHFYMKLNDPQEIDTNNLDFGLADFPAPEFKEVEVHVDDHEACKMAWLPSSTRTCVAAETFHHGNNHESHATGKQVQAEHHDKLRLARIGECVLSLPAMLTGERIWRCNDEKIAPRQVHEAAAFFHFHHWDEYVAMSKAASSLNEEGEAGDNNHAYRDNMNHVLTNAVLPGSAAAVGGSHLHEEHHTHVTADCLVLYLRYDRALVLEACATAQRREQLLWSMTKTRLLLQHFTPPSMLTDKQHHQNGKSQSVDLADSLSVWRRKVELGPTAKEEGETEEDILRKENKRKKQRVMKERSRRQKNRSNRKSKTA